MNDKFVFTDEDLLGLPAPSSDNEDLKSNKVPVRFVACYGSVVMLLLLRDIVIII